MVVIIRELDLADTIGAVIPVHLGSDTHLKPPITRHAHIIQQLPPKGELAG